MLRDPDAAADCVQDVFCTAATRLHQLREHDKLRPWLYAIARHEALARLRSRRREQPADVLPEHATDQDGPEVLAARGELAALVADAAGGLGDRDRAVLELHYRHGLDGPELAHTQIDRDVMHHEQAPYDYFALLTDQTGVMIQVSSVDEAFAILKARNEAA